MRVLICPDKFAGTIGAAEAAAAIARGWASVAPDDVLELRPLSDGGPGFVEVIAASVAGRRVAVPVTDPLGRPVAGEIFVVGTTAYVESAQACGLHLLTIEERNPRITTSYGLGALISAAIGAGADEVVIGLGGSATNDAGAGLLAALGAVPVDASGQPLPPGGAALAGCARLSLPQQSATAAVTADSGRAKTVADGTGTGWRSVLPILDGVRLVGATDVDNPLTGTFGATAGYGPQKGATPADVTVLDAALWRFVGVLEHDLDGVDLDSRPGAGAAGGLGAAILALGGALRSGIGLVRALTGFDAVLDEVDLVMTGEGSLDAQSLRGKVVAGVANGARDRGVPCVVLAGRSSVGRPEARVAGVSAVHTLVEHFGSGEAAMARPAEGLSALAARLAGEWSSGRRNA